MSTLLRYRNRHRLGLASGLLTGSLLFLTCKDEGAGGPGDMQASGAALTASYVNTRTDTASLLWAAIEMQLSGEPLAEAMGRDLAGYDRNALVPDVYTDPTDMKAHNDVVGYSAAVEVYEYSKLAMNMLSFESGAGLSLMYGPVLNPTRATGTAALALLRDKVQALALASRAGVDKQNGPWVIVPAPTDNELNRLGFPGLVPQFAELRGFESQIEASGNVARGCSLAGGYGASAGMKITVGDYECGYNSLHIDRSRADKVLSLDALGLSAWKQALWAINYFQLVHDVDGRAMTAVDAADSALVGKVGNTVRAYDDDPAKRGTAGTYIGPSDLEGFQGLLMVEEIDNKAGFLLGQLTSDGAQLGGFASIKAALDYDYQSTPRFFPHAVAVTEVAGTGGADAQPTALSLSDGKSRLSDLAALLGAYAEQFAMTDLRNTAVGGSATSRPVFDGDPFATDNGMPDGEATAHDRALAVLKVALVNLDRLHLDPKTGALSDEAQVASGGAISRGGHASTLDTVRALIALRTAYRALTAQLTLYSNATPDTTANATALDTTRFTGAPGGATIAQRLQQLIKAQADFLSQKLVAASGLASNGYDLAADKADAEPTTLEAQAAAVYGLLEAYLATSNADYRSRAQAAYAKLEESFYVKDLRLYRPRLGEETTFSFTPARFGVLTGALRTMYVLVAARPGQEALRTELEARIGRLNKLVLNGWDDRNSDGKVDWPGECLRVEAALPRGGLQMAERALTGELGSEMSALTSDRDRDCVPEVDDVKLPASLASEIRITRR
ncbi:MAG: hypothetical protein U1A78_25280 [Polyangia bacterium]